MRRAISVAQSGSMFEPADGDGLRTTVGGQPWFQALRSSTAVAAAVIDMADLCPERLDRQHVPKLVFKDNDLNYRLVLSEEVAEETCAQLERDSAFLAAEGIMDYSLLIGVRRRHTASSSYPHLLESHLLVSNILYFSNCLSLFQTATPPELFCV